MARKSATAEAARYDVHPGVAMVQKWADELPAKTGRSLERAAAEAMADLRHLTVPFPPRMNLVAVSTRGAHVGFTTVTSGEVRYAYQTGRMDEPATRPRHVIPLRGHRRR